MSGFLQVFENVPILAVQASGKRAMQADKRRASIFSQVPHVGDT
jgi:hypothetical protein